MSKPQYFQLEVKGYERIKEGVKIKGFASTPDFDRHSDIVYPTAFQKALSQYQSTGKNIPLLRSHNPDRPVGKIPTDGDDAPRVIDKGFFIHGIVTEKETAEQVEAGELQCLSVAIIPTDFSFEMIPTGKYEKSTGHQLFTEARIIKEVDLVEVSVVATPANPNAVFSLEKSVQDYFTSHPSPTMEHTCDFCPADKKDRASGKIGDRFICKGCMNRVEFKGEKVEELEEPKTEEKPAEEPKKEETKPATQPQSEEAVETADEKPAAEAPAEKAAAKDGDEDEEEEKIVVTPEQKQVLTNLLDTLKAVDEKTVVPAEEKAVDVESKALDIMLPVMLKMAQAVAEQQKKIDALEAKLASVPVRKGKTITSFQHTTVATEEEKSSEEKGVSFASWLKTAAKDGAVTVGDDE
jgi:Caudovirus prohead protease.